MSKETWVPVCGYENFYEAHDSGLIRNAITHRVLKPRIRGDGYNQVTLCDNNGRHQEYVHRLIAKTFIPNEFEKPQVNHKDENKSNNAALNLEWVTSKENNNYGTAKQRMVGTHTIEALRKSAEYARTFRLKPVINLDTGKVYETVQSAAKEYNGRSYNLVSTLKRRHKTFMGCRWSYYKEEK